jgi:hypothetical protein
MTQPLYTLFKSPRPIEDLGCWAAHCAAWSEIIGYSPFGLFFLRDPVEHTYVVLHPLACGLKSYGVLKSTDEFERTVLRSKRFMEECLRPNDLDVLQTRLGRLRAEQVYYPVPYPFLGGSGELDTYSKGDAWVFVEIVGQSHGLDAPPPRAMRCRSAKAINSGRQ